MKIWVGIKIREVLTTGEVFLETFQTKVWVDGMQDEFNEILVFDTTEPLVFGYNPNVRKRYNIPVIERAINNG